MLSTFGVIGNESACVLQMCPISASLDVTIGKVATRRTEHPPQMPLEADKEMPLEADKLLKSLVHCCLRVSEQT